MSKLKYLSGGQNKNKNKLFWNKILFWNGHKYIDFFHVHTYSEDDVEEGGIKIKKKFIFFMKMAIFWGGGRKKGKK
jgi:hypothetical protein